MFSRRKILAHSAAGAAVLALPHIARAQDPVRIGAILTLSGPIVVLGQAQRASVEVATDLINRAGGINGRPLEVIVRDDKLQPAEAVAQVRDLLGQGVNLFIGGIFTPIALAISGLMPDNNGVFISTAAIGDSLTHEAFNRHYFRGTQNASMYYYAAAEGIAQRNPGVRRWGTVIPDLEGLGLSNWRAFSAGLKRSFPKYNNGAAPEFVDPVFFKLNATDFKSQISAAMALPVDGLFISSQSTTFWQQAKLLGLEQKVKTIVGVGGDLATAKIMGKNFPPMWTMDHWNYAAWTDKNKLARGFYDAWVKKTGDRDPSGFVEPPYSALLAFVNAIDTAKSTEADKLIPVMEGMTWESMKGPKTFRKEDHQALQVVDIYKIVPSNDAAGFAVIDNTSVDASTLAEPPTPGKAIVYPT